MYVCEPEYDINLFVCMHRNKNACQTVTVRFLNKQTNNTERNRQRDRKKYVMIS